MFSTTTCLFRGFRMANTRERSQSDRRTTHARGKTVLNSQGWRRAGGRGGEGRAGECACVARPLRRHAPSHKHSKERERVSIPTTVQYSKLRRFMTNCYSVSPCREGVTVPTRTAERKIRALLQESRVLVHTSHVVIIPAAPLLLRVSRPRGKGWGRIFATAAAVIKYNETSSLQQGLHRRHQPEALDSTIVNRNKPPRESQSPSSFRALVLTVSKKTLQLSHFLCAYPSTGQRS